MAVVSLSARFSIEDPQIAMTDADAIFGHSSRGTGDIFCNKSGVIFNVVL